MRIISIFYYINRNNNELKYGFTGHLKIISSEDRRRQFADPSLTTDALSAYVNEFGKYGQIKYCFYFYLSNSRSSKSAMSRRRCILQKVGRILAME